MNNKKNTFIYVLAAVGLHGVLQANQNDVTEVNSSSICHNPNSQLSFDINKEAKWKIASGEKYQPIAVLNEPRLYEICRSGALFSGKIQVATDTGLQLSTELPISSCVVVYSKRIGIYSSSKIELKDTVSGTYRILDSSTDKEYESITHVQSQINPNESKKTIIVTGFNYGNPPDTSSRTANYRFCQEDSKLVAGQVRGVKINKTSEYLNQLPISRDSALFGSGSCVDFTGSSVHLVMENELNSNVSSLMCGKVAYRLDPIVSQ